MKALKTLHKYSTHPALIYHVMAVAAALRRFAKLAGENEEYWESIGILHGLVYEKFYDTRRYKCREIFEREGFDEREVHAFNAHGYGIYTDVEPNCYMEYALCAVDQLTGFIASCARASPKRKLEYIDVAAVKRMMDNKDFASGTKRIMQMCAKMGKDPDWVVQETLTAMQNIAEDLGL